MPEYLAPGVYVEEVSYRSSSIEGVSTTTTGFIGPARSGPAWVVGGSPPPTPDVLTSLSDFEATFGDGQPLAFDDEQGSTQTNFLWHAARAFFTEGGQRLYVVRVYRANDPDTAFAMWPPFGQTPPGGTLDNLLTVKARWPGGPGAAGQVQVSYTLTIGQNVLTTKGGVPAVGGLVDSDVVWIGRGHPTGTAGSATYRGDFYLAQSLLDPVSQQTTWQFQPNRKGSPLNPLRQLTGLVPPTSTRSPLDTYDEVRPVTLTVTFYPSDPTAPSQVWSGLVLDPSHQRAGAPDSVTALFAQDPSNESLARTLPITIFPGVNIQDGLDVLQALGLANSALNATTWNEGDNLARTYTFPLDGGSDGNAPKSGDYGGFEGTAADGRPYKTGLMAFEDIEEISIVAAPGSTFNFANKQDDVMETINLLIAHAQNMKYRIAVLDCGDKMAVADVLAMRGQLDSTYGEFYYPWVKIVDPITSNDLNLPPSGFVAGIYARNDINRSVSKAPANEVVTLAVGFETLVNKGQQEVLNPAGVNCFRFFEGRGYRLWGARLISSDPEWKYVNLRRYFAYLERSIDVGTQFAVFEPNGPPLWTNIRRTISDFLFSEYQAGNLLGDSAAQAFFVRCDRTTMTQNDLDNGRMVCLIGVSPVYPAEFVIFRIGQWTASTTS